LRATTDYEACRQADVVLIAVETPVEAGDKKPAYRALRGALQDLAPRLRRGAMVVIESTIAPKTMELLVRPLLEEGSGLSATEGFFLVNCPERVMPGKLLANIQNCHRVVGGMTPAAAELAVQLYGHVVQADLDPVDCLTAEMVKTMENAYRDVQIAFANEMALLCEDMGADVWQVRELVNKSPYRAMHLPGAGVGGHCIPKDPWLLIANASPGFQAPLTRAARAVNDGMPLHMADLVVDALREAGRDIKGARVAVLGYAYLENSDDTRNTPSEPLVARLRELGAEVVIHDPYVPAYMSDWQELVAGADAAVVMVAHDEYSAIDPATLKAALRTPVLVDGRHVFAAARLDGLVYRGVGQGNVHA
jgi:UDP-N-acetyl-D-mannosaminuronic acid dehydrogenase